MVSRVGNTMRAITRLIGRVLNRKYLARPPRTKRAKTVTRGSRAAVAVGAGLSNMSTLRTTIRGNAGRPVFLLPRRGLPSAQRSEGPPLAGRRVDDDGGGHARADQYTLGHIVDMDAHRDALSEPDPLEGWVGIDEELGPARLSRSVMPRAMLST